VRLRSADDRPPRSKWLENLERTPQERLDRMISMLRLTEEMQRAMKARR
jgi:hypothetical protein